MTQSHSDQAPHCDCCGEVLGPEHVATKSRISALSKSSRALLGLLDEVEAILVVRLAEDRRFLASVNAEIAKGQEGHP